MATSIKFGIVSTAKIGEKVSRAFHAAEHVQCVAVGSRSLESAEKFALANNIPNAYGSYQEVVESDVCNAVYVSLPTSMKEEWAIKAANAGKHILVEKPFVSEESVQRMVDAARANNVLFMDGTMWVHHVRTYDIANRVQQGLIGDVRRVTSTLTVPLLVTDPDNIRFHKSLEPHGALGDLGWYTTKAILFGTQYELPSHVQAYAKWHKDESGEQVPSEVFGTMWFPSGKVATFDVSFLMAWRQWFELAGSLGDVHNDGFVLTWTADDWTWPAVPFDTSSEWSYRLDGGKRVVVKIHDCVQQVRMAQNFARIALGLKLRQENGDRAKWEKEALYTQRVLDALYASCLKDGEKVPVKSA